MEKYGRLAFLSKTTPPKYLGSVLPFFLTFGNFLGAEQSCYSATPLEYGWGITPHIDWSSNLEYVCFVYRMSTYTNASCFALSASKSQGVFCNKVGLLPHKRTWTTIVQCRETCFRWRSHSFQGLQHVPFTANFARRSSTAALIFKTIHKQVLWWQ